MQLAEPTARRTSAMVGLATVVMMVGCGLDVRRGVAVFGTVTVETQPLADGLITFVPTGNRGGQKISTRILDGRYAFSDNEGLIAGDYRVEIYGMPAGVRALAEGKTPSHQPEKFREVASEYNRQSTLHCNLADDRPNQYDFKVRYETKRR